MRRRELGERPSPFVPHQPTERQAEFLAVEAAEVFYGGAAGGGKSEALLMAALTHVEVPGYAAILFRRTYSDLALPGALMARAQEWLAPTAASWSERDKRWTFPSGATLSFGYLETETDKYRYQSAEFQFVGFDELTQFTESQYLYLFSRLRRRTGVDLPLRMRGGSNPGGVGHEWVRARFVDASSADRVYVPARLTDNPHLDQESYRDSLMNLDPTTREQLLNGDWQILPEGEMFKRAWFTIIEIPELPRSLTCVRYWDKAGTEGGRGARTAGILMAKDEQGLFYVLDALCGRWSALEREQIIREAAKSDGQDVAIWVEQEPGSGGKESAEATIRNLAGFVVQAEPVTGDKVSRARPFAAQAEAGNVKILRGSWNHDYLSELCAFPLGALKDQVDASSGAFNKLLLEEESWEGYLVYEDRVHISPF